MKSVIICMVGLLFSSLIFQVSAVEKIESDNTTNIELDKENRFLLGNVLLRKCRNIINRPSAVQSSLTVTLTRLANNRLYYFSPPAPAGMRVSFAGARRFCSDHGMHLVIINNAAENALVFAKAAELGLAGVALSPGAWIGLLDTTGAANYQWIPPGASPVLNFFPLPPAANMCGTFAAGLQVVATSWAAVACAGPLPFICEMEPPCSLVL